MMRVCVFLCLSLTHMLMSEAPGQKESCDSELLALHQFLSELLLSWAPSVTEKTQLSQHPHSRGCIQALWF